MTNLSRTLLILVVLLAPLGASARSANDAVAELQSDWAVANYELNGDAQERAFETLLAKSEAAVADFPDSAGVLIWDGIVRSTFAGVKGGLGALSLAKQSRKSLELAMKLDANALAGSAYTSLGTLYYKVPGWPVGFGNDKKAGQLLQQALEINPDGIDPNYFYADFLISKKRYAEAEPYLLRAQHAAARPGREIADAGRQEEIRAALAEVRGRTQRTASR